jgi:hypothetical protein
VYCLLLAYIWTVYASDLNEDTTVLGEIFVVLLSTYWQKLDLLDIGYDLFLPHPS